MSFRSIVVASVLAVLSVSGVCFGQSWKEADAGVDVRTIGQTYQLRLDGGQVLRESERQILDAQVFTTDDSREMFILWNEASQLDGLGIDSFYVIRLADGSFTRPRQADHTIHVRYSRFDPLVRVPRIVEGLGSGAGQNLYLVQYLTPAIESFGRSLEELGGRVVGFMPSQTQIVELPAESVAAVRELAFVRWVGAFHPAYRMELGLVHEFEFGQSPQNPRRFRILVTDTGLDMKATVGARIEAMGGRVDLLYAEGRLFEATLSAEQLGRVAQMDEVLFVDLWGAPEVDMDVAREIGGANYIESIAGFTGQGVRAEVFDTGVLTSHVDFQATPPLVHGGNGSTGHGTSVYGINFGDGTGNASARGMMPDAEQGIVASFERVSNREAHTAELVDPDGVYRAVFQTNSWGDPRSTTYTNVSAQMDQIIFDNDILITQSQSNSGGTPSRPQAWAKNIVSVGGAYHSDTLNKADDRWNSGGSTGPAADGRIKPDLTHFYDRILTTSGSGSSSYTQFSGTSGATPIVSGHFGLLFQMWAEGVFGQDFSGMDVFEARPHASTAKALMISTAEPYDWTLGGSNGDITRVRQGWGMPDLRNAFDRGDRISVVDEEDVLAPFESITYIALVQDGEPDLRVTLVYTDLPGVPGAGVNRVNDLSLKVTSPNGDEYWGNNGLMSGVWSTTGGSSNSIDTVENVFIPSPVAGNWVVEVFADEINQDSHIETPELDADFSMVITGGLLEPPALVIQFPNGRPDVVGPGEAGEFVVRIREGLETLVPDSAMLHYRSDGGEFEAVPLVALGGDEYQATTPLVACATMPEYYISAEGDGGTIVTDPIEAPTSLHSFIVGEDVIYIDDDFEADAGWTVENLTLLSGGWVREVPTTRGRTAEPDGDFDGSGACWVTGNTPGLLEDVDGGPTILTSSVYDLTDAADATLSYAVWFYNDDWNNGDPGDDDFMIIEISNDDGQSWVQIEELGGVTDGWEERSYRVGDLIEPTSTVRFRFTATDQPNNSVTEAAIDALLIEEFRCDDACEADCDGDGAVNTMDFLCFLNLFNAGSPEADCNGDGDINTMDFLCFLNLFNAGC